MESIEKRSLSDSVVNRIINAIRNGDYRPGDRLPTIQKLSDILNVGLSSVREGLRQLQSLGIVEIHHGRGIFIKEMVDINLILSNVEHILIFRKPYISNLLEARKLIECETVKLAAKRASKEKIALLCEKLNNMKNLIDDINNFAKEDVSFHLLIAESTENPVFEIFLKSIHGLLMEEVKAVLKLAGAANRAIIYHENIYRAINERIPEKASEEMANHINDIERAIKEELKKRPDLYLNTGSSSYQSHKN